jgi:hypothetical protein
MRTVTFGYAGKWTPDYGSVQQAAHLVKSDPTPVGVEAFGGTPWAPPVYRVATNNDYYQAAQGRRIVWTAIG